MFYDDLNFSAIDQAILFGGVDPSAQAYLNAITAVSGTRTSTRDNAINTFVVGAKAAGIWSKLLGVWPIYGGNAASHAINLKTPGTFNITWTGGITHNTNGFRNDRTGHGDTGINPATVLGAGVNTYSMGIYTRTQDLRDTLGTASMGARVGDSQWQTLADSRSWTDLKRSFYANQNNIELTTPGDLNVSGFIMGTREASTTYRLVKNGTTILSSATTSSTTVPNINIFIGAFNNAGSASQRSRGEHCFAFYSLPLTSSEEATLHALVQNLQVAFARSVACNNNIQYNITCTGDSITEGDALTYQPLEAWPGYLGNLYSTNTYINHGVSGANSSTANGSRADTFSRTDRTNVEVVLIDRDFIRNSGAPVVGRGLTAYNNLVTYVNARRATGKIMVVCTIPTAGNMTAPNQIIFDTERTTYNTNISTNWRNFADLFVDVGASFNDFTNATLYRQSGGSTQVALTAAGQVQLAGLIYAEVSNLFGSAIMRYTSAPGPVNGSIDTTSTFLAARRGGVTEYSNSGFFESNTDGLCLLVWSCAGLSDPTRSGSISGIDINNNDWVNPVELMDLNSVSSTVAFGVSAQVTFLSSLQCNRNQKVASLYLGFTPIATVDASNMASLAQLSLFGCSSLTTLSFAGSTALTLISVGSSSLPSFPAFSGLNSLASFECTNALFNAANLDSIYTNLVDRTSLTAGAINVTGAAGAGTDNPAIATAKNWVVTG